MIATEMYRFWFQTDACLHIYVLVYYKWFFYVKIFSEVSYLASNSSLMYLYMLVFAKQTFYVYMCHGIKFKLKIQAHSDL